jgi:hypothetical protein
VLTPIGSITRGEERIDFANSDVLLGLRETIVGIQTGAVEDKYGWMVDV